MKKSLVRRIGTISLTGLLVLTAALPASVYAGARVVTSKKAVQRGIAGKNDDKEDKGSIYYTESYEDLYKKLKAVKEREYYYDYEVYEEAAMGDSAAKAEASDSMSPGESIAYNNDVTYGSAASVKESGYTTEDFSNTNLRDQAVDEADIVKTDGQYIYMITGGCDLVIAKADGMDLELVSRTGIGTEEQYYFNRNVQDFYLDGDRLYVISSDSRRDTDYNGYYGSMVYYTSLYTYDITDRAAPVLTGAVWQDGDYIESRRKDGCIYLFSSWHPTVNDTMEDSSFIPKYNEKLIPAENFCFPQSPCSRQYLITGAVKAEEPDSFSDIDVFVSGAESFYVSASSIYVMNVDWDNYDRTEITKFSYLNGQVEGTADTYVDGRINDSFSLDEYDGNLRVLVTYTGYYGNGVISEFLSEITDQRWTRRNALIILDKNLDPLSMLTGIARDEEVRSARFMGDIGYFVTFENTDPLFTVDLSDPASPKILGELKVTGFSSYLHPYGENRMLGMGYDADENGWTTGIKLSLFDMTDKSEVRELSRSVINGMTYCPALHDYKLVLADARRNVIGFYCENRFFIYKVENDEILREKICDMIDYDLYSEYYYNKTKGLYIADTLYICGDGFILPVDLLTMEGGTPLKF